MLASDRTLVLLGIGLDHRQAFVTFGQARGNALQHPCAIQVQPIQSGHLGLQGSGDTIRGHLPSLVVDPFP
jgi:hypothetical protein